MLNSLAGITQQQGVPGGAFNPETDITWHSLFWAEGTAFTALSYADAAAVDTWPNETSEFDVTGVTNQRPTYRASSTGMNSQPTVDFNGSTNSLAGGAFTSALSEPFTMVMIARDKTTATGSYFTDCNSNSMIFNTGTASEYRWFPGSTINSVGALRNTTDPRLFVAHSNGASSYIDVDLVRTTGTSGSPSPSTGFTMGAADSRNNSLASVDMSLVGLYSGDFTADGSYTDFKTWVTNHYGITL